MIECKINTINLKTLALKLHRLTVFAKCTVGLCHLVVTYFEVTSCCLSSGGARHFLLRGGGAKPGRTKFLGWQSVIHANHYDFGVMIMITIFDLPLRHYDCLTQNYDF
jgi:hypothetical protein